MKKMLPTLFISIFVFIVSVALMAIVVKGDKGTNGEIIEYQNFYITKVEGPFESTNTNSRYALIEAIVNDGTFFFDNTKARFSAPDIAKVDDKFISLFMPGISFIGIPFYILGKQFALPQFVTFLSTIIFGFINMYVIAIIGRKLGIPYVFGLIGGLIFLFATNALPYALTLTQHQASTTIVLLGFLNAISSRTIFTNITFGVLYGIGMLVDIPNAFLLFPAALYILFSHFSVDTGEKKTRLKIKTVFIFLLIGLLPMIGLVGWYNHQVTGSYTTLPQFIGRSNYLEPVKKEQFVEPKQPQTVDLEIADTPFDTRLQFRGMYILLVSDERGILYYTPVALYGLLGLYFLYRIRASKRPVTLLFAIAATNLVIYATFGDAWGGWSYGPRYLIPAIAISCIGIGMFIERFKRNILLLLALLVVIIYGAYISGAAALTTNAIPPKGEALNLEPQLPYTYTYNFLFIDNNESSSLLYNIWLKDYVSLIAVLYSFVVVVSVMVIFLYSFQILKEYKRL